MARQLADQSDSWIRLKKLTIGSENLLKSDAYDIA
jgi:hypothetical protein